MHLQGPKASYLLYCCLWIAISFAATPKDGAKKRLPPQASADDLADGDRTGVQTLKGLGQPTYEVKATGEKKQGTKRTRPIKEIKPRKKKTRQAVKPTGKPKKGSGLELPLNDFDRNKSEAGIPFCTAPIQGADPFALSTMSLDPRDTTTEPPSATKHVLAIRKGKSDVDLQALGHIDSIGDHKAKKENCLLHRSSNARYAQLRELLNGMNLLANVLNDIVVGYLDERVFLTEPQLVVKFNYRVRYDIVGDVLLLVGLNTHGERVVCAYNLLDIKTDMLSDLREDETLLGFRAYHDHGVHLYVEKGRILVKSSDGKKELLEIPGLEIDFDWNPVCRQMHSKVILYAYPLTTR